MRSYQYDGDPGQPQGAGVPSSGYVILLVDDDDLVSSVAEATLRAQGHRVLCARDSDEAMRISDSHPGPLHLLITDQVMPPYMSGPELATCLRLLRPDLKVMYISGYGASDSVQDEVADDFADFLPKPFSPDVLTRKVEAILADVMPGEDPPVEAAEEPPSRARATEGASHADSAQPE